MGNCKEMQIMKKMYADNHIEKTNEFLWLQHTRTLGHNKKTKPKNS
jgi:hypothetical protein